MLEPNKDFIIIYDGDSAASPILLRFSGIFEGSQLVISSQPKIYIYFFSNYAVSGKGFKLDYKSGERYLNLSFSGNLWQWWFTKSGCNNIITESYGTITSPGNNQVPYANSQSCSYTIQASADTTAPAAHPTTTLVVNKFDVIGDDSLQVIRF